MPQGLYVWSKTAATDSNVDASINWAEGQAPSSVNDSARAMMARLAEARDDWAGSLTTGGTSTAYTLSTNQVFDTLAHLSGQKLKVRFNAANGAAATLNVDSLGAKAIQIASGVAVPSGALTANSVWDVTYDNSIPAFLLSGGPALVPAAGSIANSQLANMAAWTLKGNNSGSPAAPGDFTIDALTAKASPTSLDEIPIWDAAGAAMKKATLAAIAAATTAPTVQRFTSGSALTYTPTAGIARIRVRMCGGGGGGAAATTNNGSNGGDTSFGSWTALHGSTGSTNAGQGGAGGSGGVNGTGTLITRIGGGAGGAGTAGGTGSANCPGGSGGNNPFGGAPGASGNGAAGTAAAANSGAGGSGGSQSVTISGGGGGAGEYVEFLMTAAQVGASQTYTVGAAGSGGAAGVNAGGNGAAGQIIVEEFYV